MDASRQSLTFFDDVLCTVESAQKGALVVKADVAERAVIFALEFLLLGHVNAPGLTEGQPEKVIKQYSKLRKFLHSYVVGQHDYVVAPTPVGDDEVADDDDNSAGTLGVGNLIPSCFDKDELQSLLGFISSNASVLTCTHAAMTALRDDLAQPMSLAKRTNHRISAAMSHLWSELMHGDTATGKSWGAELRDCSDANQAVHSALKAMASAIASILPWASMTLGARLFNCIDTHSGSEPVNLDDLRTIHHDLAHLCEIWTSVQQLQSFLEFRTKLTIEMVSELRGVLKDTCM